MTSTVARRFSITAGSLVLAAALTACGSSGSSAAPGPSSSGSTPAGASGSIAATTTPAAGSVITIVKFAYRVPGSVAPGAKVTVTNMDQVAHTVTADGGSNLFDVTVDPGSSATFTAPDKPGAYKFHCKFHANMHGALVVK